MNPHFAVFFPPHKTGCSHLQDMDKNSEFQSGYVVEVIIQSSLSEMEPEGLKSRKEVNALNYKQLPTHLCTSGLSSKEHERL